MLASSCLVDSEDFAWWNSMDFSTKAGTPRHETLLRKLWEPASEGLSGEDVS